MYFTGPSCGSAPVSSAKSSTASRLPSPPSSSAENRFVASLPASFPPPSRLFPASFPPPSRYLPASFPPPSRSAVKTHRQIKSNFLFPFFSRTFLLHTLALHFSLVFVSTVLWPVLPSAPRSTFTLKCVCSASNQTAVNFSPPLLYRGLVASPFSP